MGDLAPGHDVEVRLVDARLQLPASEADCGLCTRA